MSILQRVKTWNERRKQVETLSESEIVKITQDLFAEDFKRIGIQNVDERIKRLRAGNFKFHKIPEQEHATGLFRHRSFQKDNDKKDYKEIEIDNSPERNIVYKLGTSIHEGSHAMSASEEDAKTAFVGLHKYVSELSRWGYCGLDEGLIEHYTQYLLGTYEGKNKIKNFDYYNGQRKENHPYKVQVSFWENIFREIAQKTLMKKKNGEMESSEEAYKRVRDTFYKQFFERNSKEIFELLKRYANPASEKLFALLLAPRGKEGSENFISGEVSKDSAEKVKVISDSMNREVGSVERRETSVDTRVELIKITDKWYLNPKSYPDKSTPEYIGKTIAEFHRQTIINQIGVDFSKPWEMDIWDKDGNLDKVKAKKVEDVLRRQFILIGEDMSLLKSQNRNDVLAEVSLTGSEIYHAWTGISERHLSRVFVEIRKLCLNNNPTKENIINAKKAIGYFTESMKGDGYYSEWFYTRMYSVIDDAEKRIKK
jgi:hypothetical protein